MTAVLAFAVAITLFALLLALWMNAQIPDTQQDGNMGLAPALAAVVAV